MCGRPRHRGVRVVVTLGAQRAHTHMGSSFFSRHTTSAVPRSHMGSRAELRGGVLAQNVSVGMNRGGRRARDACSNAYPRLSSRDSDCARPMNEMPTGRAKTKPIGTVSVG